MQKAMKVNQCPIEELVPHDHPMILIDELLTYDDEKACCQVTIHPGSNFYNVEKKSVPSYVAIEYMAQGIAAFANANEKDRGGEVAIGFLVSSRKFKMLTSEFSLGEKLQVFVEQLYVEESGLSAFDCQVKCDDDVLATAKINIFQPSDASTFLAEQ